MKLKREVISNIVDDCLKKSEEYNNFQIPDDLYLDCFKKIMSLYKTHDFEYDY